MQRFKYFKLPHGQGHAYKRVATDSPLRYGSLSQSVAFGKHSKDRIYIHNGPAGRVIALINMYILDVA